MTNAEVARVFHQVADLMEIKGDDSFRVSSYRRVARSIDELAEEIEAVAARGGLGKLGGVGKSSVEKIQTLLDTGSLPLLEELKQEVPETLLDLLNIPNLGPKKVALLWQQRGIESLKDLKRSIEMGSLDGLKGFGDKSIQKIAEGIAFLERSAGRIRIGDAWPIAERLREAVSHLDGVKRVEHAGSLRRGKETVGDLDLLCVADNGPDVIEHFVEWPGVTQILAQGDTKGSVLVKVRDHVEIQVDLRVVPAESFGAAWQYFTGSKEHNVRLRERATKRGWTLNEYSLSEIDGGKVIASKTEAEIYQALELPEYPPELREDRGEFELKKVPKDLLTIEHIRGELHMHTTASDGKATIEEMAAAAKARGYEYICITDHSKSSAIANGLDPARLRKHIKAVRAANDRVDGIEIMVGSEVDVHADGTLDYDDDLLAELDFVVASLHFGMTRDIEQNTERTLAAIRSPYVNLIAHPTGRLINRREAMPLDIERIAKAAAENGTALEINANHYRLDLKDTHARLARDLGATLAINCDAHNPGNFELMRYGILTARRGGILKGDVLNTRSVDDVRAFVQKKRERA